MFPHWPTFDVLFLFMQLRSFYNFSHNDEFHERSIVDEHLTYFFSSSRWYHFTISLSKMNFTNVSLLTNIQCTFSLHPHDMILEFLSRWWISPIFHNSQTSDALFLIIQMRSFYNFSHHDEFHKYFITDQHPMYLFSSSRWIHFRISLKMINFTNVSSMTNIRCIFSLHPDEIILQFLLAA